MSEPELTQLLERAAAAAPVNPPPLARIVAGSRRRRRLRVVGMAGLVVVAVGGVVAVAGVLSPSTGPDRVQPAAPAQVTPTPSVSPPPLEESIDLDGTWVVTAFVGADGQSLLPASRTGEVRLTFANGELTGTNGCNEIIGVYQQPDGGADIVFDRDHLGGTLVSCPDEIPLVERLLDVRHVSGEGDVRRLHAGNWMIVVQLERGLDAP